MFGQKAAINKHSVTKTTANIGLLQGWLDIVIIGCSSLSAAVSADGILLGF